MIFKDIIKKKMEQVNPRNYIHIVKGLGIAFVTTFIFLFILSLILTYTDTSETIISPTIIIVAAISILIGSSISNMKIKKNGLINGAIIGGMYIVILYLFSSVFSENFSLTISSIIMVAIGIVFGILGGIIGVNIKT